MRKKLSESVRERLLLEAGLRCPVPKCEREVGLDIHHIDKNHANDDPANLLVLCSVHHRMAHEGSLSIRMCRILKELLRRESRFSDVPVKALHTRSEYLSTAIHELSVTEISYRSIYVGPLFLHPEWYFNMRDRIDPCPNYDRHVKQWITKCSGSRRTATRIILRNTQRYRDKVESVVRPSQRRRLIEDILRTIDDVWGNKGHKGPLICCVDTGFLRIPIVHDQSLIVASRSTGGTPIDGGVLYTDASDVKREREMFDAVFEMSHRGMRQELELLRDHVSCLWKGG